MLADENMRAFPSIRQRHHQLLSVPKGNDDSLPFVIQSVDHIRALNRPSHGFPQPTDDPVTENRNKGMRESEVRHAQPRLTDEGLDWHIMELGLMQPFIHSIPTNEFRMRADFDNAALVHDDDTIRMLNG